MEEAVTSHSLSIIKEYRRKRMASRGDMVTKERVLKGGHGRSVIGIPKFVYCVKSTKAYVITGGGSWGAVVWERGGAGKIVGTLKGHTGDVYCLDTTPCEKYVVTGSVDCTLILWKLSNGNRERSFVGHTLPVYAVAVTPSGDGIVSGSLDWTAILWNIHDSSRLFTFKGHEEPVFDVDISSSGLYLYTCSFDTTAIKWSMKTGKRLDTFRGHEDTVRSCYLTSDDKYLFTASDDKTAIVWNADDTTQLQHKPPATALWHYPVAHAFKVTCAIDSGVRNNEKEKAAEDPDLSIKEYRRKKMTSKGDMVKKERVLKGGHGTDSLFRRPHRVHCVTSTKKYVITGGEDFNAVVWERGGVGKIVRRLEGHRGWVFCLDTTPCEKYVVTGSWDCTLILWKLSNGNRERSFVGHTVAVCAVAVTPSGDGIVSGSGDGTAILWNIHDSSRLLTFKGHEGIVWGVVVSSSGLHLYTCSYDKTAIKWSMKTGERLDTFRGHEKAVRSCCLTSDDKYLLTAADDETAIVWNADDTTRLPVCGT
eukprot:g706.t1